MGKRKSSEILRKESDTERLARTFVVDFLNERWDIRYCKQYLAQAKQIVNPRMDKEGNQPESFSADDAIACLQCLVEGVFKDWPADRGVRGLGVVFLGNPPFIKRMAHIEKYLPPRPDYWKKQEVLEWNQRYAHLVK